MRNWHKVYKPAGGGGGGWGEVSPRKSVVSVANKEFIEETDKNFDFITEIPFRFLGVGDFKVSIVIEN